MINMVASNKISKNCEECPKTGAYRYLDLISYCKEHFTKFVLESRKAVA
jgi:hypothetical protein